MATIQAHYVVPQQETQAETPLIRDESIDDIWKDAQARFLKTTSKSLRPANRISLDDVLKSLDAKYSRKESSDDDDETKKRAKKYIMNTLNCIQLLGGIAAEAASTVFGPATLCFSAISFLIEIPAKVNKLFAGLADLFEEVDTSLKQFSIYKRIEQYHDIEPELIRTTHELMISVVDICALSIKVLGKWNEFKAIAKLALFRDDSGVGGAINKFKQLVSRHGRISDAVTLENVLKAHDEQSGELKAILDKLTADSLLSQQTSDQVNFIFDAEQQRKAAQSDTERIEWFMRTLSIEQEKIDASNKRFRDFWEQSVPKTGNWLQEVDEYKKWTAFDPETSPVLILAGSVGSGKSHIVSAMVSDARSRQEESTQKSVKTSIAYYFPPERDRKTESMAKDGAGGDSFQPATALKALAVQIAKHNAQYAKDMKKSWTGNDKPNFGKDVSYAQLCTDLQLFEPKNDAAYILLLDGLDQLSEKSAKQLISCLMSAKNPKVRILVSGTAEILKACLEEDDILPRIELLTYNEPDIRNYVEAELDKHDLLQQPDKSIVELRAWIINEVPKRSRGNFSTSQRFLSNIQRAVDEDREDDIRSLVKDDTFADGKAAAREIVSGLNSSLNSKDIEELNELLIWTIYGSRWLNLAHMKAVLYLRYGRTSLLSLEKKVTGKYAKALRRDGDGDFCAYDEEIDALLRNPDVPRPKKGDERETGKISMTVTIHQADVDKVKRFLWDLNETAMFHNFTFQDASRGPEKAVISAHPVDGALTLVRQCLKLLIDEPNPNTDCLLFYPLGVLPYHLVTLADFAKDGKLDFTERKEVVERLLDLCRVRYSVEKNWTKDADIDNWFGNLDTFKKWFEDQEVLRTIAIEDRLWIEECFRSKDPGLMSLKDITKVVAKLWLYDLGRTNVEDDYTWVARFIKLESAMNSPKQPKKAKQNQPTEPTPDQPTEATQDESAQPSNNTVVVEESDDGSSVASEDSDDTQIQDGITRAIAWTKTELSIKENTVWFQKIGKTYAAWSLWELAKTAFLQAKSLPDPHWTCGEDLALAYAAEDIKLAIAEMEPVTRFLKAKTDKSEDEKTHLTDDLRRLAEWQEQLQPPNVAGAISLYQEIRDIDSNHYGTCWKLLELYSNTNQLEEGRTLLESLSSTEAKDAKLSNLGEMLWSLYDDSWYENEHEKFELVFQMTRKQPLFSVVLETLDNVITVGKQRSNKSMVLASLLLSNGVAFAHYSEADGHLDMALDRWRECYNIAVKEEYRGVYVCGLVSKYMGTAHLAPLISSKGTEDPQAHILELTKLGTEAASNYYVSFAHRVAVAGCHTLTGDRGKAREHMKADLQVALDFLSDDDPHNDWQGYCNIAETVLHAGDALNALSAWSLIPPNDIENNIATTTDIEHSENSSAPIDEPHVDEPHGDEASGNEPHADEPHVDKDNEAEIRSATSEKAERAGNCNFQCDGRCGTRFSYADDFYICKFCLDCQFDGACVEKLRKGELKHYICDPNHDWLHIPPWSDEVYNSVPKDHVRVGGELVDGKRVGGDVILISEWLNSLRAEWGLPLVPVVEKPADTAIAGEITNDADKVTDAKSIVEVAADLNPNKTVDNVLLPQAPPLMDVNIGGVVAAEPIAVA